jgi:hypothetical protein|tara:strand:+ start:367 stop:600 length:234 start_codon:yes stop_codon:yes gene_type:complete
MMTVDELSNVLYQSATILVGENMEQHDLHVRIDGNIVEGMKLFKKKYRRSMATIAQDALRDYLAKHDIITEQPDLDV